MSLLDLLYLYLVAPLGFGVCCLVLALAVRELWRGYAELLKGVWRRPRFGIFSLFGIVTVFAIASAMLRGAVALDSPEQLVVGGVIAVVFAVGIVAVASFVVGDLRDNWVRRRDRQHRDDSEAWEQMPPKQQDEE
jgi:hypothetical protein